MHGSVWMIRLVRRGTNDDEFGLPKPGRAGSNRNGTAGRDVHSELVAHIEGCLRLPRDPEGHCPKWPGIGSPARRRCFRDQTWSRESMVSRSSESWDEGAMGVVYLANMGYAATAGCTRALWTRGMIAPAHAIGSTGFVKLRP